MLLALCAISQAYAFSLYTPTSPGPWKSAGRLTSQSSGHLATPVIGARRARTLPLALSMQEKLLVDEKVEEEMLGKFTHRATVNPDTNPEYGDTGGAMLLMEDVTVSRGDRDLMSDVQWRLLPGERVGLVGPNGAGKSTLLSAAAGRIPVMGKVLVKNGVSMGYLVQTAVSGSQRSCWDEASSQMHRLNKAQQELDEVTSKIEAGDISDAVLNKQADALSEFEAAGGYNVDEKVDSVLKGLGFTQKDFAQSCADFSGGWQMKIALARLLLSEPDMLLLDEPTNHLDAKAKNWLGGYISGYQGTVVIVTHEEALLQSAALTSVIEVRDQKAQMFRGNYGKFQEERVNRVERAQKQFEEQQREIDKLEGYIARFGATASHAASAQSKMKALEKIERVEAPTDLEAVSKRQSLRFPRPQFCEEDMIELKSAAWGWNDKALYSGANVKIERGMRMVVLGPNGCGKSTLLAALSGKLPLQQGTRTLAESLEMGVFTQDLAQDLDMTGVAMDVVLEKVREKDPTINNERARAVMGALGLTGTKALQKIGTMSGGEKARVALSMFVLVPHNLLILDEPSNHLDMSTVQVLTEALQEYKGTIVVVTHNRPFCELLAPTHVATVLGEPGRQTIKVEERPLRPSDWESMTDDGSGSTGGGMTLKTKQTSASKTLTRKEGAGALEKEEEAPRELYPWEVAETSISSKMSGKKLTPQEKKIEKMQKKMEESGYDGGAKAGVEKGTFKRKGDMSQKVNKSNNKNKKK